MAHDKLCHKPWQKLHLVHVVGAHVHIKEACPVLHLFVGKGSGSGKAALLKFCCELLLACGVDALSYDGKGFPCSYAHKALAACEHYALALFKGNRAAKTFAFQCLFEGSYVGRRCSAAAAKNACAKVRKGGSEFGKAFRPKREDSCPVFKDREACVGFGKDRHRGDTQKPFHYCSHGLGPYAAVGAKGCHAEILHGLGKDFRA